MSELRCYVASPYDDAPLVREVHARLRALGVHPTSAWAEHANGPERLDEMPIEQLRAIAVRNDVALAESDVVIVLPREGRGREMYGEARLAVAFGIPVLWVGPTRCLTAYRAGVERVATLDEALAAVAVRRRSLRHGLRSLRPSEGGGGGVAA